MIQRIREKRKAHYELDSFKKLFCDARTRHITNVAYKGAVSEGYATVDDIVSVINQLNSRYFYKSMTTHHSYEIWQDVYRYQDGDNKLYIKVQVSVDGEKAVLIQMKRDEGSDE